jgi:predicted RND superfamily exporter protein
VGLPRQEFLARLSSTSFIQYLSRRGTVLDGTGRVHDNVLYKAYTGFSVSSDKSRIEFAFVGFNATYGRTNTANQANKIFERWRALFNEHAKGTGGYQTTELYVFRATQNEMIKGAVLGVCLSLVVAFVVMLVTTMNWWISLLGIANILAIVCLLMGFFPIFGWSLGENECIFMIAAVGLSVDYTVHLLHAYNHATEELRAEKTRVALGEMVSPSLAQR